MSYGEQSRGPILGGHLTAGIVVGAVFGTVYFILEPLLGFWGHLGILGVPPLQVLSTYLLFGVVFGGISGLFFGAIGAFIGRWATPERYVPFYAALMGFVLVVMLMIKGYNMFQVKSLPKSPEMITIVLVLLAMATAGYLLSKIFVRRRTFRRVGKGTAWTLSVVAILIVAGIYTFSVLQERNLPKRTSAGEVGPNVVFLLLDALRYDHVSAYGYHRETTPNIDRLAEEGVLFLNARSQGNKTIISMPSVFTSLYPSFHGTLATGGIKRALHESHTTLAEVLQEAGYTTIELTTNPNLRSVFGMTQGFDRVEEFRNSFYHLGLCRVLRRLGILDAPDFISSKYGFPRADELTDYALRYLDAVKDRPFFLYVHYMDTHHAYLPPPPYDTLFGDGSKEPDPAALFTKTYMFLTDSTGLVEISPEELAKLKDYYDGCIRFNDEEIGRILDEVRKLSETRETLVIIAADHGDEFLEHGMFYHTNLAYEELLHVPLIIWYPQRFSKGQKVESMVRLIDLFPTIAATAGARVPPEAMGTSLVPLLTGEVEDLDLMAIAEGNYCYALNYKNWKIMKVDSTDAVYLYDLSTDPKETTDVSSQQPQVFEEMSALLDEYLKKIELIEHAPGTELDPETIKQLKALGYL